MDILAVPGQDIPLWLTHEARDPTLYPLAYVYDESLTLTDTVPMSHVGNGVYVTTWTVPSAQKFMIDYQMFVDPGHTTPAEVVGAAQDFVQADDPSASPSEVAQAVWGALTGSHVASGSFGRLLRVLASVAGKQFFRLDNIVYNTQGFMTQGRLRIFPDSASASASTPGGTGEGELEVISLAATPSLTFPDLPTTFLGT